MSFSTLLHDVKAGLMTSSSLCDLHWPQVSDYPSCRFGLSFLLWQISSSLLQVAGRASISLGLRSINLDDVMLLARVCMTSSYRRSRLRACAIDVSDYCACAFLREYCRPKKGTAVPGFEPSTLSMPKTPMRYDALDRSTTTAGWHHWIIIIAESSFYKLFQDWVFKCRIILAYPFLIFLQDNF